MITLATVAIALLVAASAFFSLVAVVGFYRLPDVYSRAHAASKSETLGALLGLSAAAVAIGPGQSTFKLALLALFVLVTGPTAAHAIVRAAADAGTIPWSRDHTITDPWSRGRTVADGGRTDGPARTGTERTDRTDRVERTERTDRVERTDLTDRTERAEGTEGRR